MFDSIFASMVLKKPANVFTVKTDSLRLGDGDLWYSNKDLLRDHVSVSMS